MGKLSIIVAEFQSYKVVKLHNNFATLPPRYFASLPLSIWPASSQALCDLFSLTQQLVRQQQWPRYTPLVNINYQTSLPLTFHLVSG